MFSDKANLRPNKSRIRRLNLLRNRVTSRKSRAILYAWLASRITARSRRKWAVLRQHSKTDSWWAPVISATTRSSPSWRVWATSLQKKRAQTRALTSQSDRIRIMRENRGRLDARNYQLRMIISAMAAEVWETIFWLPHLWTSWAWVTASRLSAREMRIGKTSSNLSLLLFRGSAYNPDSRTKNVLKKSWTRDCWAPPSLWPSWKTAFNPTTAWDKPGPSGSLERALTSCKTLPRADPTVATGRTS